MRIYRGIAGLIGCLALILQYVLILQAVPERPVFATINFFSYFTILSNLMVSCALVVPTISRHSRAGAFLLRPRVRSAIALYIGVTGIIYATILQAIWSPQGWAFVADTLLHYVMPVLYLLDWILFVDKSRLRFAAIFFWMVFPALFAAYSLARGSVVNWYPYPSLDAGSLGYGRVAFNTGLVVLLFGALAGFLIWAGRFLPSRRANAQS